MIILSKEGNHFIMDLDGEDQGHRHSVTPRLVVEVAKGRLPLKVGSAEAAGPGMGPHQVRRIQQADMNH